METKWLLVGGVAVVALVLLMPKGGGPNVGLASQQIAAGVDTSLSHDNVANNAAAYQYRTAVALDAGETSRASIAAHTQTITSALRALDNSQAVAGAIATQRMQTAAGIRIAQINGNNALEIEQLKVNAELQLAPEMAKHDEQMAWINSYTQRKLQNHANSAGLLENTLGGFLNLIPGIGGILSGSIGGSSSGIGGSGALLGTLAGLF
jgi:hypothetical protein